MAANYLALDATTKLQKQVEGLVTSAGAGDAGKIPALDADGRLNGSVMPAGIGADTQSIQASETLADGDFVNIHNVGGAFRVRKADASTAAAAKRADGFVRVGVAGGAMATVFFEGPNSALTGLLPGQYVLSHTTPGGILPAASGSTTTGHIIQFLGTATLATELNTEIQQPTIL